MQSMGSQFMGCHLPKVDYWYIPGVARLFFSRAKIEDTLFGVGLRIENSEKQKFVLGHFSPFEIIFDA